MSPAIGYCASVASDRCFVVGSHCLDRSLQLEGTMCNASKVTVSIGLSTVEGEIRVSPTYESVSNQQSRESSHSTQSLPAPRPRPPQTYWSSILPHMCFAVILQMNTLSAALTPSPGVDSISGSTDYRTQDTTHSVFPLCKAWCSPGAFCPCASRVFISSYAGRQECWLNECIDIQCDTVQFEH